MARFSVREEQIAPRLSPEAYSRALQLYHEHAVEQVVQRGRQITAQVRGFHQPFYTVNIALGEEGVQSATCTCVYEFGEWCKHIGAVLLTCIRNPERVETLEPIETLLHALDAETLRQILLELAQQGGEIAQRIEVLACAPRATPAPARDAPRFVTDFVPDVINLSIIILGTVGRAIQTLIEQQQYEQAFQMIRREMERLILLRHDNWFYDVDHDADYDSVNALGYLLAEVILSLTDSDEPLIDAIVDALNQWRSPLGESSDAFRVCALALSPRAQLLDEDTLLDLGMDLPTLEHDLTIADDDEDDLEDLIEAMDEAGAEFSLGFDIAHNLVEVRLRLLERQGRVDDYLELARASQMHHCYAIMCALQGEVERAAGVAQKQFKDTWSWFSFARALDALGHTATAVELTHPALRKLTSRRRSDAHELERMSRAALAEWLAGRAESLGNYTVALEAIQIAVRENPTLRGYQMLQRLAGDQWAQMRRKILQQIPLRGKASEVAEIYIYEGLYETALEILDQQHALTPPYAMRLVEHAPEATRQACLHEAQAIIRAKQSNLYPLAAEWLAVVKKSYQVQGDLEAWNALIQQLMTENRRKPALMPLLERLAAE
ncbi:MAG: SWIM zinc finger family protein [Fimbriimonadales bacterium]|nr:MAG: hypothetical protein KatS3mg018_1356 [Fimbriimonadales bacterium]